MKNKMNSIRSGIASLRGRRPVRALYLNRTVVWLTVAGYAGFMILFLCMNWYLIAEYQRDNHTREAGALRQYTGRVEEDMSALEGILRDIYLYDEDFNWLAENVRGAQNRELAEFSSTYSIVQNLKNRMAHDESMHGFYLFYRSYAKSYYGIDMVHIKQNESYNLNRTIQQMFQEEDGQTGGWSVVREGENSCLLLCYPKGAAALFGLYSLENAGQIIGESLGETAAQVVLMQNGLALQNEELAESLRLSEITEQYADSYEGRIGNQYVYGSRITNTDVWVFMAVRYNIWSVMNLTQMILLLAAAASVCCVLLLIRFMRKELAQPLRSLTDVMNHLRQDGSYPVPETKFRFRELQEVSDTLKIMVVEIERQKQRAYEEIIERQKATMQYLQLQLKPHFYLNGLKTLNALAVERKTDKMQELILSLSEHLRYLLQTERERISLGRELDFVENYVSLQRYVTGRRVECSVQCDPEERNWEVPVLCVQTFVENSIKYARFGSMSAVLQITVTVSVLETQEGRFLDLVISDNGQGYPEEVLEKINRTPGDIAAEGDLATTWRENESWLLVNEENVGINNIRRRCRFLYGNRAEYSFYNDGGAVSELILPEYPGTAEGDTNESVTGG
ncbi:MAG: histidine kinase [Eubacteriales bacterium]|nr:histidine kinase [Eubacteriales bacterium]